MSPTAHLGAGPDHWDAVHRKRAPDELTWFQATPRRSLELIHRTGLQPLDRIVDVGGGSSHLCDELLNAGFRDLTTVDISAAALAHVRSRVEKHGDCVTLVEGDIGEFRSARMFDLWHDRAVFHFLIDEVERSRYVESLDANLATGGFVVMATFGIQGPETCSGLPVRRYGPGSLAEALGPGFEPVVFEEESHTTPGGGKQQFLYGLFRRSQQELDV